MKKIAAIIGLPLLISTIQVFHGHVTFWYDNARDLMSAWNNLSDPTLIGPTSGIPGIFYGPYWIWLLSIGSVFSKDPRMGNFVAGILPYLLIFPYILWKFHKMFERRTIIIIWFLFIFGVGTKYVLAIWNPNVAPVLFLLLIYLMMFVDFIKAKAVDYVKVFAMGVTVGLILNFHISFGIGVALGTVIFLLSQVRKDVFKKYIIHFLLVGAGFFITVVPFLVFELRNGFQQILTLLTTLMKYGAVVNNKGLSKLEIVTYFFSSLPTPFITPRLVVLAIVLMMVVIFFVALWKKKIKLNPLEEKLGLILASMTVAILFIYLSARNPVWEYHFIGVEIILLLFISLVINRHLLLQNVMAVVALIFILVTLNNFIKDMAAGQYQKSHLATQEYIVDTVAKDAGSKPYTVFSYSPSIYTYEYSYLFKWRHNKEVPFDPNTISLESPLVYLIAKASEMPDFLENRTPGSSYKTLDTWEIDDGTVIIKRGRIQ